MFSTSIAYLADNDAGDGEFEAGSVAARFSEAWRQLLVTVCATVFLIGTEETARATYGHPSSGAGFAVASAGRLHGPRHHQGKPRCTGCGAIVAKREVSYGDAIFEVPAAASEVQPATYYEFTIRLRDGSTRLIIASNAEAWREGERVSVIENMKLAKR